MASLVAPASISSIALHKCGCCRTLSLPSPGLMFSFISLMSSGVARFVVNPVQVLTNFAPAFVIKFTGLFLLVVVEKSCLKDHFHSNVWRGFYHGADIFFNQLVVAGDESADVHDHVDFNGPAFISIAVSCAFTSGVLAPKGNETTPAQPDITAFQFLESNIYMAGVNTYKFSHPVLLQLCIDR